MPGHFQQLCFLIIPDLLLVVYLHHLKWLSVFSYGISRFMGIFTLVCDLQCIDLVFSMQLSAHVVTRLGMNQESSPRRATQITMTTTRLASSWSNPPGLAYWPCEHSIFIWKAAVIMSGWAMDVASQHRMWSQECHTQVRNADCSIMYW